MLSDVIVIATQNKGKVGEFQKLFSNLGMQVKSLNDYASVPDIVEDGLTFADNALKKARIVAETFGIPALADDSGLCVDALGGAPGVYSARYAGEGAKDSENNMKLLAELKSREDAHSDTDPTWPRLLSQAHFVCSLAMYDPDSGRAIQTEGRCSGHIIAEPRGSNGFGYDPLFYIEELKMTMAELSLETKNAISHRSRALQQLLPLLRK